MEPRAAFPIMMGSGAFMGMVAAMRFVSSARYATPAALGLTLGGIPGVFDRRLAGAVPAPRHRPLGRHRRGALHRSDADTVGSRRTADTRRGACGCSSGRLIADPPAEDRLWARIGVRRSVVNESRRRLPVGAPRVLRHIGSVGAGPRKFAARYTVVFDELISNTYRDTVPPSVPELGLGQSAHHHRLDHLDRR